MSFVVSNTDIDITEGCTVLAQINEGSFGECFLFFDRTENQMQYKVIKVYKKPETNKVKNEFEMQKLQQCPLLLNVYEYWSYNQAIIMDFLPGVSINDFMERLKSMSKKLNELYILQISIGMAMSVKEMHKANILHRDIKSDNVLLDSNLYPHIIDWSEGRKVTNGLSTITNVTHGTYSFVPKEAIVSHESSEKTDIYGIGTVIAQLITQDWLYSDFYNNNDAVYSYKDRFDKSQKNLADRITLGTVECWFDHIFKILSLCNNDPSNMNEEQKDEYLRNAENIVRYLVLNDITDDIFARCENILEAYPNKLEPLVQLCKKCLDSDQKERPTADELYDNLISIAHSILDEDTMETLNETISIMKQKNVTYGTIENIEDAILNGFLDFKTFENTVQNIETQAKELVSENAFENFLEGKILDDI